MQSHRGVFREAHSAARTVQGASDPYSAEDEKKPVIHEG